eukprot:82934_1
MGTYEDGPSKLQFRFIKQCVKKSHWIGSIITMNINNQTINDWYYIILDMEHVWKILFLEGNLMEDMNQNLVKTSFRSKVAVSALKQATISRVAYIVFEVVKTDAG